jgi:hypothetical protein
VRFIGVVSLEFLEKRSAALFEKHRTMVLSGRERPYPSTPCTGWMDAQSRFHPWEIAHHTVS